MLDFTSPLSPSSSISSSSSQALPAFEALAPPRPPTTTLEEETIINIPGLTAGVKLKVDAGPGCGGIAWPAGEVLSRYLAYRHEQDDTCLRNQTIIELGSGTGLVGIVTALLDPSVEVWITDQQQLLNLMRANAIMNIPSTANIHVAELKWGEKIPSEIPTEETSVILAADCVYFEPAFPLLVKTLCDLALPGKDMEILFCWKKRRKADKRFFVMLRKHFDLTPIADDRPGEKERYTREGVSLMRLRRRV